LKARHKIPLFQEGKSIWPRIEAVKSYSCHMHCVKQKEKTSFFLLCITVTYKEKRRRLDQNGRGMELLTERRIMPRRKARSHRPF